MRRFAPPIAILVAGIVVYCNTFSVPFLFDDLRRILENRDIRTLWPPTVAMSSSTRPFAAYTFAINYALHGYDLWGYHAFNLAIHLAAGLSLFGIVQRTLLRVGGTVAKHAGELALTVALIWVSHPLQTQAVTYLIQRLESLMGLAYLATLYGFIRAQDAEVGHRRLWYAFSLGACALGMGCKEVMATAPLIVLWYDRAFIASSWGEIAANRKYYYAGLAATWILLVWSMLHYTDDYTDGGLISVEGLTPWTYLLSQAGVLIHYLRLCFWPQGQNLDYGWPTAHTIQEVLPQLFVVTLLFGATLWCIFKYPKWSLLGGWFFVILAPTSSIVPVVDLAFEHRMYLPLAAVVVASVVSVFWLTSKLAEQLPATIASRWVWGVPVVGALFGLGYATYQRNAAYVSAISIWTDVVQKAPDNSRGWCNLGLAFAQAGEHVRACELLENFLRDKPQDANARMTLGMVLNEQGNHESALRHLQRAVRDDPKLPDSHINLGHLLLDRGNFDEAARHYQTARDLGAKDHGTLISLAGALIPLGRYREAQLLCTTVLQREPHAPQAHVNLACALAGEGRLLEALQHFREALHDDPAYADAHAGIAQVLADRDREKAMAHMTEALRLKPDSPNFNLGMSNLVAREHPEQAIKYCEAALRIRPLYPEALFNLANAWVACGRPDKAISYLELATKLAPDWPEARNNLRILRQMLASEAVSQP